MAREVKAKKRCCGSSPRCKRCPVVLRRLVRAGLAERHGKRLHLVQHVPGKKLKKARAR